MKYNPKIHNRRSIRLKGYDYSQAGLYYITICVQNRECLFGKIVGTTMQLNDAGQMVHNEWLDIPNRFPQIQLHEFIVMPNHFHTIMAIVGATPVGASLVDAQNRVGAQNTADAQNGTGAQNMANTQMGKNISDGENENNKSKGRPQGYAPTVGDVVGAFKSITTNKYIDGVKNNNWPRFNDKLWQRNYWEHIIRDEKSYQRISDYIINNPVKWTDDKFHRA